VQDDLVVVVHVVHLGNFRSWTGTQSVRRAVFDSPNVLTENGACTFVCCSLLREKLQCYKDCKAAHINLVILDAHIAASNLLLTMAIATLPWTVDTIK